jgi:hypothetical protein
VSTLGNFWVAFLFSLGAGGWVYGKTYRKTGGNTKNSLAVAIGCGLLSLVIVWIILGMIFH